MAATTILAELFGINWLFWWQIPLIVLVVALLLFLKAYRNKHM